MYTKLVEFKACPQNRWNIMQFVHNKVCPRNQWNSQFVLKIGEMFRKGYYAVRIALF